MTRVVLIHWNRAEAEDRCARLQRAGYEATPFSDSEGDGLRAIRDCPPDAFVIDLSRVPSHGRAVATWLRQQKATRGVPIVFVAGDPEKVARVRELLPDAMYAEWSGIRGALRRAVRRPPAGPVVPGTMESYSGRPLPGRLGIRAGSSVVLLGAPEDLEQKMGPLPENVRLRRQTRGRPQLVLLFAKSRAELERRFPAAARALAEGGGVWIAWPKKSSAVRTDLNQSVVRAFGLNAGFVDYKICAIDETWSGLLFARRRAAKQV
jgi:CheY-like chemotaxis protein